MILLLIAEGCALFGSWAWRHSRLLWLAGFGILFFHPIGATLRQAVAPQPYLREGLPSVLAYMEKHGQAADHIHLYGSGEKSFRFYAPRFGLDALDLTLVQRPGDDWDEYVDSLNLLQCRQRVWLVFAHIRRRPVDDEGLLLHQADRLGTRLRSVASRQESPLKESLHEATAHLYDFSSPACRT